MTVLDTVSTATGLDPDVVHGYAETLTAAGFWPPEGEPVEPGHAAALLIAIRRENAMVIRARSLEELQSLARQRSRIPARRPNLETQLRRRGVWDDMGALKGWLRDDLTRERNEYAKSVMQEIEAEREAVPAR